MAIPYIINLDEESKEHESLIAQAKNGAGKSGAFIIGSLLRIDPSIQKPQVVIVAHSRELVIQLAGVISRILEHAPSYKLCNLATDKANKSAHIIVSTLKALINTSEGRNKVFDLRNLRVFVLDEADIFIKENNNLIDLQFFHKLLQSLKQKIQYVFFSATYERDVAERISKIVKEAYQIELKKE